MTERSAEAAIVWQMPDKRALIDRIADLRKAASQARTVALSREEPELRKSLMELARKLDEEANDLEKAREGN